MSKKRHPGARRPRGPDSRARVPVGAAPAPPAAPATPGGRATGAERARAPRSTAPEWAVLAIVLGAALWLQRGVIGAPFFADDYLFLDAVRGRGFMRALLSPDPLANYLRPVSRQIHFWWLSRVAHESPWPFHVANLALLLISLALLHRIARRFTGALGATLAAALVALHYIPDVSLRWASGSQDLLALAFALGAILLQLRGQRVWAALCYALALLSKETVILTPVIAWLLNRELARPAPARSRTRVAAPAQPRLAAQLVRLAPMLIAGVLWAALSFATRASRPGAATSLHPKASFLSAALVHFFQSLFALEWGAVGMADGWKWPPVIPLLLIVAGLVWLMRTSRPADERRPPLGAALIGGLGWALLGAAPVAGVAPIWSAYYYLFALCGAALALGAVLERLPRAVAIVALIAFASLCARASAREEFATASGEWTTQSHVTGFYIQRSTRTVASLLEQLERLHPTLPPNTTLFFGGVPPNIGWQTADGPLFRWAYRDTSVRSHFIADFTRERAARGPDYFFELPDGQLKELWTGRSPLRDLAFSMLVADHVSASREALGLRLQQPGVEPMDHYLMAWIEYEAGQTDSAYAQFAVLQITPKPGPAPEVPVIYRTLVASRDTSGAIVALSAALRNHPLDARGHGLLADLLLLSMSQTSTGIVEAYAARALDPRSAPVWRRWALVQISKRCFRQAAWTLDRYFQLGGFEAAHDTDAIEWRRQLQLILPGGQLAQEGLKNDITVPAPARP